LNNVIAIPSISRLKLLLVSLGVALTAVASPAQADEVPGTWPHGLRRTAAIVEADVTGLSCTYDDYRGARTVATLRNITCHRGALPAYDRLELATLGGRLPSGEFLTVTFPTSWSGRASSSF
jgi:hypothetical protein